MGIVTESEAVRYSRVGLTGKYYQLPEINEGTTVAWAELTGEHGERTVGERARIYYILDGKAKFLINGESLIAEKDDVVSIPPQATYNFWPEGHSVKLLLVMELLDISKLPK